MRATTSDFHPNRALEELGFLGVIRAAALIALPLGAVGSLVFMLDASRHRHPPPVLMALFAMWVLSPSVVLLFATVVSKRWSVVTRTTLYTVTLALAVGSLGAYAYAALATTGPRTTSVFVIVPPLSLLLIATVVPIAALISRRVSPRP